MADLGLTPAESGRRALLVATGRYTDPTFASLRAPEADVAALAEVLADPAIGGFGVDVLLDRPSHEIRVLVNRFFGDAGRDELVLFYVSGHGVKDEAGELHFATTDTDRRLLASTSVSAEFVRRLIDQSAARAVVVWLDCCFAGAFPPGQVARAAGSVDVLSQLTAGSGRGCAVMTASTAVQYAFEHDTAEVAGVAQPSVFTEAVVRGLRTGAADLDADGVIDARELYDYVHDQVRAATPQQTPTRNEQVTGELHIAHSPRGPRLDPRLPPAIRQALRSGFPHFRLAAVAAVADLARQGDQLATHTLRQLSTGADQELARAAADALRTEAPPPPPAPAPPAAQPEPVPAPPVATGGSTPGRAASAGGMRLPRGVSRVRPAASAVKTGEFLLVVLLVGLLWWLTAHADLVRSPGGVLVTAVVIPVVLLAVIIDLVRFQQRLAADQSVILVRARASAVAFSPDGGLFSYAEGGGVTSWRTGPWRVVGTVRAGAHSRPDRRDRVTRLAFGPDSALLAAVTARGAVTVWETATWRRVGVAGDDRGSGAALAFSPDGTSLAGVGPDQTIVLWSTATGRGAPWTGTALPGHHAPITSLAFHPSTQQTPGSADLVSADLVSADRSGTIRCWRLDQRRPVRQGRAADVAVHDVAVSPDGTWLATAAADGTVCVRDTATLTAVWARAAGGAPATSVVFSPDGALLASAGADADIRVRDAATGHLITTLTGHRGPVNALAFSPDGAVLASSGADRTVRLWSTAGLDHRPRQG